ncbi:unnamed protein product [Paramecium octaurelia]|uniref:Uncharacterized protein n=1 Tax=Paramecium octaurelia TaxID=43137 RepID=A0A8S1SMJ4_PAROT|nr:unnamed protein product [Paramecium octaurelia]
MLQGDVLSEVQLAIPCIQLKSSSVRLTTNMQKCEIDCLASYELTIGFSDSKDKQVDLNQTMEFILYGRQYEIKNITYIPSVKYPQVIKLVKQQFNSNEKQSNLLKSQKPFKSPCSYMTMNALLNKIQDDCQQITLLFQFAPEKLESCDYDYIKSLEDQIVFKLQISYVISRPISGLRFINNLDNKFLITEKGLHNSRNWIPTPHHKQQRYPPYCHEEKDLLHYSKIIITVPSSYYVVASGKLQEIVEIDGNDLVGYVFNVDEFINPDDLGIFIGEFQHHYANHDEFRLNIFHMNENKSYLFESETARKIFESVDRFWFRDALLQKARTILSIGSGVEFFRSLNVLILPNVQKHGYLSFYPFRNILVFDESQLPESLPCKHTQDEFYRCLNLQLNALSLKFFLAPSVKLSDRWIELGFTFQSTWTEDYAQLHQKLLEQIKNGQDVKLDQTQFEQRFLLESLEYQLKTRMVITMLARMTHQPDVFIKEILNRFYQDLKGSIPAPLSTDKIFMSMKKVFSVSKGKSFLKMFIKSAGAWHFKVSYDYERDHKLNLNITQSPLIGHWVHVYTNNYIQGAKALDIKSDIIYQFLQFQEKIKQTQKSIQKAFKDFEEQQKEQPYDQSKKPHSSSTIKDFKRRDYQIQASGLIPEELSMPLHFSGWVRIQVSETNELKLEIENTEIKIPPKLWTKIDINCTQKLKKYNIPKRHLEINAQAYIQEEQTGKIEIENDNNNQVKTPMIHGILGEAVLKSGVNINTGREQTIKSYSEEIQKEPPQWIKWDPVGLTVKEVEYQIQKELVVMCQVLKEKDMNQIACVLRNIKKLEIRERVVRTIVLIIENSYAHLESNIIVQLLQLLREMVNKSSIKRLEENCDFEDMAELQAYLKLAEKITYRFFFNQNDNSLKYLKFNNFDDYDVIVALLKNLRRLNTASTLGFHNELIALLVSILQGYDNSQNQYDCSYMISKLIKLLLFTNCNQSKFLIMTTLKHELKKVIFLNTPKNYILKTIIIHYKRFTDINFSGEMEKKIEEIYKKYDEEISSIIKHHQSNVLVRIDNGYLERAYYKKYLLEQYEKQKKEPYHFILDQLYYLSKKRVKNGATTIYFNVLLQELQIFMAKNYQRFAHELSRADINPELAKTLAHTNFECIISGPALLNYNVQSNFASIYRILFYYFAPLRTDEVHKDIKHLLYTLTNFTPDQQWSQAHSSQLVEEQQELTKRTCGQQPKKNRPVNRSTNQDLIQQLERFARKFPNKLSEREITKQILKHLGTLPQIGQLEEKVGELSPSSKQIYRIDQVRASMKRKNQPMNIILDNVLSMFEYYYRKQQLNKNELDDYCQMVRKFFDDGKKVLENYSKANVDKKVQKMVIKSTSLETKLANNTYVDEIIE